MTSLLGLGDLKASLAVTVARDLADRSSTTNNLNRLRKPDHSDQHSSSHIHLGNRMELMGYST